MNWYKKATMLGKNLGIEQGSDFWKGIQRWGKRLKEDGAWQKAMQLHKKWRKSKRN